MPSAKQECTRCWSAMNQLKLARYSAQSITRSPKTDNNMRSFSINEQFSQVSRITLWHIMKDLMEANPFSTCQHRQHSFYLGALPLEAWVHFLLSKWGTRDLYGTPSVTKVHLSFILEKFDGVPIRQISNLINLSHFSTQKSKSARRHVKQRIRPVHSQRVKFDWRGRRAPAPVFDDCLRFDFNPGSHGFT